MIDKNIEYKSKQIVEYYQCNRQRWDQFYPSERWVFEKVAAETGTLGDVLDVGCACGGLGAALSEKKRLSSYTGIDINKDAIGWAVKNRKISAPADFVAGDIVDLRLAGDYDVVISLSCADWNIETDGIIRSCWEKVKKSGYFIVSLRLTDNEGINDIRRSYQYINFSLNEKDPEVANYAVFNLQGALRLFRNLKPAPELIGAYGYWGAPSQTAVTIYKKLAFTVFYIRRGEEDTPSDMRAEFSLPADVFIH